MKFFLMLPVLAAAIAAGAQTLPVQAAQAARPEAAVPPVPYQAMTPAGFSGLASDAVDWKAANAEVGQFRRGHRDIVRWEKDRAAAPAAPAPAEPKR